MGEKTHSTHSSIVDFNGMLPALNYNHTNNSEHDNRKGIEIPQIMKGVPVEIEELVEKDAWSRARIF